MLETQERSASTVLEEYAKETRASPKYSTFKNEWYEGVAAEECNLLLAKSDFSNFSFHNILPPKLPNGDSVFGSCAWQGEGDDKKRVFTFSFIERWTVYKGFSLECVLYPNGRGSVWLGKCNNSAAMSLSNPVDAWAFWCCRPPLPF